MTPHQSVGEVLATVAGAQFLLDEMKSGPDMMRQTWAWASIPAVRDNKQVLELLASAFPPATTRQALQRGAH